MLYTLRMRVKHPKVIDIKTKEPIVTKIIVTQQEFEEMCDCVATNLEDLNLLKPSIIKILNEMKFCARFNYEFRNTTYKDLEEYFYELYEEINP
jgi:hypothetical protein